MVLIAALLHYREMVSVALELLAAEQQRSAALERQAQALRDELRRFTRAQVEA